MGSFLSRIVNFGSSGDAWSASGKHVLVTGASSGIGAELAKMFAREGCSKLGLVARSKEALDQVASECLRLGAQSVEVFLCDLTDSRAVQRTCQSIRTKFQSKLDVVVLNAGRSQGCYFEEIRDSSHIEYMLKLNLQSVIEMCHFLLPSVVKSNQSRITVVSSSAGLVGVPYRTVYCASKFGLTGFCNALRMELQDTHGVEGAPSLNLINFPEVAGTALNAGRMDFGAATAPAQFDASKALPLRDACELAYQRSIVEGAREWGQPLKVKLLLPLYSLIPNFVDRIVLQHVKKVTSRPKKTIETSSQ